MCCQEMTKLEDTRKKHREAELFLSAEAMTPAKAITTHKLLAGSGPHQLRHSHASAQLQELQAAELDLLVDPSPISN
jgi:integrase